MGVLESKLIVSLIDRVSAPSRALAGTLARLNSLSARNSAALAATQGKLLGAAGAALALYRGLQAPLSAGLRFETQLEDIGQKADIPVERLGALGRALRATARDTNQAGSSIAEGMDILLGMGASESDALGLLPAIGKAAAAYNASIADLSSAGYAALDNLKVPAEQFGTALDAMAQAGKAGAFELKDMARYFPQLGAGYQALGQTGVAAVADLSAALQIVRKGTGDSASAATNLSNVLQKIRAPQTVKAFKKLGINLEKELKKRAAKGLTPIEAIADITNKALKGDLGKLGDLFSDAQVQAGLRPLIQNIEEYRRIRDEAMRAQGVVQADYDRRIKTGQGAIMRLQAALENINIAIGSTLLPGLADVVDRITPIINRFADWAEANPELTRTIVGVTSALIALNVGLVATRFAFLFLKGGIISAGIGLLRGAAGILRFGGLLAALPSVVVAAMTTVGAAIASVTAPVWVTVAAIIAAVASIGLAIWNYWEPISNFAIGFGEVIGGALADAADQLGQFASDVAGMAGQAILDGAEWLGLDPVAIEGTFNNAVAAVRAGAAKIVEVVKAIPGMVGNWLSDIFTMNDYSDIEEAKFRAAGMRFGEALIGGIKLTATTTADFIADLPAKVSALAGEMFAVGVSWGQSIYDGVVAKVDELVAWFTGLPSRIMAAIGSIDIGSLIKWPSLPSWLGGGSPSTESAAPAVDGARASGGPVSAGRTYLVGERGPELFSPSRSGFVSPNEVYSSAASSRAAPKASGPTSVNLSVSLGGIHGVNDPEAIAARVMQIINRELRGVLGGIQADTSYAPGM